MLDYRCSWSTCLLHPHHRVWSVLKLLHCAGLFFLLFFFSFCWVEGRCKRYDIIYTETYTNLQSLKFIYFLFCSYILMWFVQRVRKQFNGNAAAAPNKTKMNKYTIVKCTGMDVFLYIVCVCVCATAIRNRNISDVVSAEHRDKGAIRLKIEAHK